MLVTKEDLEEREESPARNSTHGVVIFSGWCWESLVPHMYRVGRNGMGWGTYISWLVSRRFSSSFPPSLPLFVARRGPTVKELFGFAFTRDREEERDSACMDACVGGRRARSDFVNMPLV